MESIRLWFWWHWYFWPKVRAKEIADKWARKLAWRLPKSVVKWAFVRVYAFGIGKYGPTEEYALIATAWDLQEPLQFDLNNRL